MSDLPKKSPIIRLIRLFIILMILLVALIAAAPMFLGGFIKDRIAGAMEEQLDAKVTVEDLSFSWFSATEVSGFAMTRPGDSEPALAVGNLTTDPSWKELLSGRFIVDDIVAKDVTLRVKRTESGVDWTTVKKAPQQEVPAAKPAELPQFMVKARVENLRVVYSDSKLERPIDLMGMTLNVEAERGKDCTVNLNGPHGLKADFKVQAFDGAQLRTSDDMTAGGRIVLGSLDLSTYAPHLAQFLVAAGGTLQSQQTISYGPGGAMKVEGSSVWQGLSLRAEAGGLVAQSGGCDNLVEMRDGEMTVSTALRFSGAQVIGLPKQKQPVPCGEGALSITLTPDRVLTLSDGRFDIPGGRLDLSGSYGMGDEAGAGINLSGNTDLALWSNFFEEIPDIRGRVTVKGAVPADATIQPIVLNADVDLLRLSGGPLEDKAYDCGRTNIAMKVTLPAEEGGPRKIDVNTRSRMWEIDVKSSLAAAESAAFGLLGQASIKGDCDLEQFMAPFTDSRGQGRVRFDFLAKLSPEELGIENATVQGPATNGRLSARVGRDGDRWKMMLDGDQFTYRRGDGMGLLMPKLESRGTWNTASHVVEGRVALSDVRTVGGTGPSVRGGDVVVDFTGTADQERGVYDVNFSRMELAGFSGKGAVKYSSAGGLGRLLIDGTADYGELSSRWLRLFDDRAAGSGKGPLLIELTPQTGGWSNASGRIDMGVPQLKSYGFDVRDLVVKGTMENGKGRITQGQGRVNDGTVTLNGDVDLSGTDAVFNGAAKMERVRLVKEWQPAIARVIPLFAGIGVTAEGFINLDLTANGTGNNWESIKPRLNGLGDVALLNGRIVGSPVLDALGLAIGFNSNMAIKDINSSFQVENGGITQDALVADFGSLMIRMGGTTYLDGRLDYDLGIKPVSSKPRNWQRFTALLGSDGFLPLKLTGNIDSPKPGLPDPSKLIEAGAKKFIGEGIGNLIGGGTQEDGKKKNPLDGFLKGLGGGNEPTKKEGDGKKKNGVGGLIDLLGGNKKKGDGKKN